MKTMVIQTVTESLEVHWCCNGPVTIPLCKERIGCSLIAGTQLQQKWPKWLQKSLSFNYCGDGVLKHMKEKLQQLKFLWPKNNVDIADSHRSWNANSWRNGNTEYSIMHHSMNLSLPVLTELRHTFINYCYPILEFPAFEIID
jgi:hypothetical protein